MPVAMEAIKIHTHYDPTGTVLEVHHPGDRYELHDSIGMTAEVLANHFERTGEAQRVAVPELAAVGDKARKPKKA